MILKQYTIKELIKILVNKGFSEIEAKAFIFDCLNYKIKTNEDLK